MGQIEIKRVRVAPGVQLQVRRRPGRGRPYVLVHGLSSNARTWDAVAERLAAAGHEVVAVDLRGHGGSDKPDVGYDTGTVADDLATLISTMRLVRDRAPIVAGQSWGASVALRLAVAHPTLPRAIACVDGGWTRLADRFPTWLECESTLAPPNFTGLTRAALRDRLRTAHPDWPPDGIEATLDNFETLPDGTVRPHLRRDRHLKILHSMWVSDPHDLYPHIDVPVLLIPAYESTTAGFDGKRAAVEAAGKALRHASVITFDEADHDVHVQHPAAVADALRSLS